MSTRSRALIVLLLALPPTACGRLSLPRPGAWTGVTGRPVALLMDGSALVAAPARERTAHEVERALGRPVRVVDARSTKDDGTRELFARLASDRSLGRYEWREPQCASERAVLLGVGRGIEAIYHPVVGYS